MSPQSPLPGAPPVQSQIESPSPSDSELDVAVGSGFENASSNSSCGDRAADTVTYTFDVGADASRTEYQSICGTDAEPPSRTDVPAPSSSMITWPRSGVARL